MSTNEGENEQEKDQNDKGYEILREDYPNYDLSFKIIVIGNSGKNNYIYILHINNRCREIMLINYGDKAQF